jgi:phage anti-repressor protein
VYARGGRNFVNARELHKFLESKRAFAHWIKERIEKYGFTEGEDFSPILAKSTGGRPSTEYYLFMDAAKEIAMVENNERGRLIRRYFIEIEKRYRDNRYIAELPALQFTVYCDKVVTSTRYIAKVFKLSEDLVMDEIDRVPQGVDYRNEHYIPSCYKGVLRLFKPEFLVDREGFETLVSGGLFMQYGDIKRNCVSAFDAHLNKFNEMKTPALPEPKVGAAKKFYWFRRG